MLAQSRTRICEMKNIPVARHRATTLIDHNFKLIHDDDDIRAPGKTSIRDRRRPRTHRKNAGLRTTIEAQSLVCRGSLCRGTLSEGPIV